MKDIPKIEVDVSFQVGDILLKRRDGPLISISTKFEHMKARDGLLDMLLCMRDIK